MPLLPVPGQLSTPPRAFSNQGTLPAPVGSLDIPWKDEEAKRSSSLFAVIDADGNDGVGDERTIAAVCVEQFQTARHHLHCSVAVGK